VHTRKSLKSGEREIGGVGESGGKWGKMGGVEKVGENGKEEKETEEGGNGSLFSLDHPAKMCNVCAGKIGINSPYFRSAPEFFVATSRSLRTFGVAGKCHQESRALPFTESSEWPCTHSKQEEEKTHRSNCTRDV
jgi:hypothetical protein